MLFPEVKLDSVERDVKKINNMKWGQEESKPKQIKEKKWLFDYLAVFAFHLSQLCSQFNQKNQRILIP